MQEMTKERMRKAEEAVADYVAGKLEKDIRNPDEEISEVFAEIAPRTTGKGQIGNFASSIGYSLDLETILGEVNTWSELAAEKLIEKRFEEDKPSKEKVANILKKRVYDRVAEIARHTPGHLQDMPYHLFLMLPGILGAKTRSPTGGMVGIIIGALVENDGQPKKEFKPRLGKRIGASIAGLQDYAALALQQINAAKSTESKSLLAYLRAPHPFLESYTLFIQNERAMEVIRALDEKLSYSDSLYLDENGVETKKQLGKFISSFIGDCTGLHARIFDERCSEMAKIIEDSDGNDLELIERLSKYRSNAPEDFFKSEILAGKNPAVERLDGDFIRSRIKEHGWFDSVRTSDTDPQKGAKTFVNILAEFRSAGFGDRVYEHLARMLASHKDPVSAAWRYAAYLGIHSGDSGCLDRMESESGNVKAAFMEALCKNAEKRVNSLRKFEGYLRDLVFRRDSDKGKIAELERVTEELNAGKALPEIRGEPLYAQLQKMFPTADGLVLEKIFTSLNREFRNLRKTTDKTYTGVVMDFEIDGKRVYCKATTNKPMLAKEARYHEDAWNHSLMRPITPKLVGLVEEGGMAALFSYGTENIGVIPFEDQMKYFNLKRSFTRALAKNKGINPADLEKDPVIADMFNRALSHTLMKEHMEDPVYALAPLESIADVTKLDSWLRDAPNSIQLVRGFASMFPEYRSVAVEARDYDATPDILGHYDARPENVFTDRFGARPIGDFGLAKPGTAEFDLGKMESLETDYYVAAYSFFRNMIEQKLGNDFELSEKDISELGRRAVNVGFCNAMRIGCFKLMRGGDASRHLRLARAYSNSVR